MEAAEVELKAEDLDLYVEAAAGVVEELRDFLSLHHADLIKPPRVTRAHGQSVEMPAAASDPGYAARIHQLREACNAFIDSMRGVY